MYDLEEVSQKWKETIQFTNQQIQDNPESPLGCAYVLAKEGGSEMSINFRIKDRDRAEGFLSSLLLYSTDRDELTRLLGIEVYELCLTPNRGADITSKLADLCEFCIESGIYTPSRRWEEMW